MKGKYWGSLTSPKPAEGYRQVSHGKCGMGKPSGKFVTNKRTAEYATNVAGSHGGTASGKFHGPGKGNRDLPINRTKGVSTGHGGGPHKAGGKGK